MRNQFYQEHPDTEFLPEDNQRLSFRLPDRARIGYASGETIEHWKPRIRQASNEWQKYEIDLVVAGVRPASLIFQNRKQLPHLKRLCERHDLHPVILDHSAMGNPDMYRIAICRSGEEVARWHTAWNEHDNLTIGQLLGYPDCCCKFFVETWDRDGFRDLTIPAWFRSDPEKVDYRANILGRWIGIRAVSHMPCSFHCEPSIEIAQQNLDFIESKNRVVHQTMVDVLKMPWSYSCLHGISEIMTPVFRVTAMGEPLPKEYRFEIEGVQPEKRASGTVHPFENKKGRKIVTESKRYRNAIDAMRSIDSDMNLHSLNGFSDRMAMEDSHQIILDMIPSQATGVIDLGCGNGYLLEKIRMFKGVDAMGIERNPEAIKQGKDQFPEVRLIEGDIFDFPIHEFDGHINLGIIMMGRFTEVDQEKAQLLKDRLADREFLISYCYGDWIDKIDLRDYTTVEFPEHLLLNEQKIDGKIWACLFQKM